MKEYFSFSKNPSTKSGVTLLLQNPSVKSTWKAKTPTVFSEQSTSSWDKQLIIEQACGTNNHMMEQDYGAVYSNFCLICLFDMLMHEYINNWVHIKFCLFWFSFEELVKKIMSTYNYNYVYKYTHISLVHKINICVYIYIYISGKRLIYCT